MNSSEPPSSVIGILGGTGPQGRGLAYRWATAGLSVVIGSRDEARGVQAGNELAERTGSTSVRGGDNVTCAAEADIVIAAVPWDGHPELLTSLRHQLAGKVVVDCVNPLGFGKQGPFALPVEEGSAAQQAAALLPESTVVAAFHHVSAVLLDDPAVTEVDTDVLVLGEDREAIANVCALADTIPGMRGVYGGRLRNTGQVEALTANLIAVNKRYDIHAGLRITGL